MPKKRARNFFLDTHSSYKTGAFCPMRTDEGEQLIHPTALRRAFVQIEWAVRKKIFNRREMGDILGISRGRAAQIFNQLCRRRRYIASLKRTWARPASGLELRLFLVAALMRDFSKVEIKKR